jgi:hypothetical protein
MFSRRKNQVHMTACGTSRRLLRRRISEAIGAKQTCRARRERVDPTKMIRRRHKLRRRFSVEDAGIFSLDAMRRRKEDANAHWWVFLWRDPL